MKEFYQTNGNCQDRLLAVLNDAKKGFKVHPCVKNGKRAILKDWPNQASSDEATIKHWAAQFLDCNWGLVCNGMVVIDFDVDKKTGVLTDPFEYEMPYGVPCQETTGGGHHWFFKKPVGLEVKNSQKKLYPNADVKTDDGYVLIASVIDGKPYRFTCELPPIDELEPLPQELIERLKSVAEGKSGVMGGGNETTNGSGITLNDDVSGLKRNSENSTNFLHYRLPITPALCDRARLYLATLPPSIDGAGGHSSLFAAATAMVNGFALDDETAFSLLVNDFNPRCEPPWSEKELRHKIKQVHLHPPDKEYGHLRDERREVEKWSVESGKCSSVDISGILAGVPNKTNGRPEKESGERKVESGVVENSTSLSTLNTPHSKRPAKPKAIPRLINPATVEHKPANWLWKNKFAIGELSMITGIPGQGKSSFTCYMAGVITGGRAWEDDTPCPNGSVLFFRGEDSIERTYKKRLAANDCNQSLIRFLDGKDILNEDGSITEGEITFFDIDAIRDAIDKTANDTGAPVQMVVIDPIGNYWGETKENSNGEVRNALKPLVRIAAEKEVAVILVHHDGKAAREVAQHRVLGSTGIVGICRSVWSLLVCEDKTNRILAKSKMNDSDGPPMAVQFNIDWEQNGKVVITNAAIKKDADDFICEAADDGEKRGRKPDKLGEACEFLSELLADDAVKKSDVVVAAKEAGISRKTLESARKHLGYQTRKLGNNWFWLTQDQEHFFDGKIWGWLEPLLKDGEKSKDDIVAAGTPEGYAWGTIRKVMTHNGIGNRRDGNIVYYYIPKLEKNAPECSESTNSP